jgi:hypothetical protein
MRQKDPAKFRLFKCSECAGAGYLETTEDRIERCDACNKFATDQDAFQAWTEAVFLPALKDYAEKKLAYRWTRGPVEQSAMMQADLKQTALYRIYRRTNKYLNITERADWWLRRRQEMEELEARAQQLDGEPVVVSPEDGASR